MKKSLIFIVALFFVLIISLFYWWKVTLNANEKNKKVESPIVIGSSYWPGQYWVDIAEAKGWFKEAGLYVKTSDTQEDYYGSLFDLLSGKIDIQLVALSDLMSLNARGANFVMVLPTDVSLDAEGIVSQKEIKSISDLKGKKVGIEAGEGFSEILLDIALQKIGATRNDIIIVPTIPEMANELFRKKEIDAIITWDPFRTELIENYGANLIFSTKDMGGSISGMTVRGDYIEEREEDLKKLISIWKRATIFINEHRNESLTIISSKYSSSIEDAEQMMRGDYILMPQDNKQIMDNEFLYSLPRAVSILREQIGKTVVPRGSLDINDIVNLKFLNEL